MQTWLDASSASGASQLTLAAAPAAGQDAAPPASAPAKERLGGQAGPEPGPSSEPQMASGTLVQPHGQVAALSQQHPDSNGSSAVNITISGLPANYSQMAAACAFVPLGDVQSLQSQSSQVQRSCGRSGVAPAVTS